MTYIIKDCSEAELPLLQKFIHLYWRNDHILSKSRELIDFQHWNKMTMSYNFLLGICSQTNEIHGIMGYIPTYQYDTVLTNNGDYWGAIWKIREDIKTEEIKLLGLQLWESLINKHGFTSFAAIGISQIAKKFYKIAKCKVETISQYYINNVISNDIYTLSENDTIQKTIQLPIKSRIKKIILSDNNISNITSEYTPKKTIDYLINRYEKHFFYKYNSYLLSDGITEKVIIVTREIKINGRKIMRIVDCLGNLSDLPNLYFDFQKLLKESGSDYIDCINAGIPCSVFFHLGFKRLDPNKDEMVIPNYFEPFIKKNITIEFAHLSPYKNYIVFKGDSDQDRPNFL